MARHRGPPNRVHRPAVPPERLYTEDMISQEFNKVYDHELSTEQQVDGNEVQYKEDVTHETRPIRRLMDWFLLFRSTSYDNSEPKKKLSMLPLNKMNKTHFSTRHELYGYLEPNTSRSQHLPIRIKLNNIKSWCIDRSHLSRGIVVQTTDASYYLQNPREEVLSTDVYDDLVELHMQALTETMHDLHMPIRAKFGLLNNIIDTFTCVLSPLDDNDAKQVMDATPQRIHELLCPSSQQLNRFSHEVIADEPWDMNLLRYAAGFVKEHIVGCVHPAITDNCMFIKHLMKMDQTYQEAKRNDVPWATTNLNWQKVALEAEDRSGRRPCGTPRRPDGNLLECKLGRLIKIKYDEDNIIPRNNNNKNYHHDTSSTSSSQSDVSFLGDTDSDDDEQDERQNTMTHADDDERKKKKQRTINNKSGVNDVLPATTLNNSSPVHTTDTVSLVSGTEDSLVKPLEITFLDVEPQQRNVLKNIINQKFQKYIFSQEKGCIDDSKAIEFIQEVLNSDTPMLSFDVCLSSLQALEKSSIVVRTKLIKIPQQNIQDTAVGVRTIFCRWLKKALIVLQEVRGRKLSSDETMTIEEEVILAILNFILNMTDMLGQTQLLLLKTRMGIDLVSYVKTTLDVARRLSYKSIEHKAEQVLHFLRTLPLHPNANQKTRKVVTSVQPTDTAAAVTVMTHNIETPTEDELNAVPKKKSSPSCTSFLLPKPKQRCMPQLSMKDLLAKASAAKR